MGERPLRLAEILPSRAARPELHGNVLPFRNDVPGRHEIEGPVLRVVQVHRVLSAHAGVGVAEQGTGGAEGLAGPLRGTDVEIVPDNRRGAAGLRVEPLLRHRRQVGRHPVEQHLQRAVAVAVASAQPDRPEAAAAARVGLDAHDVPVRHLVDEVPARRHVAAVGERRRQRPGPAAEMGRDRLSPGREDHEAGVLAVRRPVLAGDLEPAHSFRDEEVPPPRHGDGVHVEGLLPPLPPQSSTICSRLHSNQVRRYPSPSTRTA